MSRLGQQHQESILASQFNVVRGILKPILRISRPSGASGFHTFPQSAASLLNAQTGNLKLVRTLLGQAAIDVTANIYTHVSPEKEREGALAIERAIYVDRSPLFPIRGTGTTRRQSIEGWK